jgi:hypothetical protein
MTNQTLSELVVLAGETNGKNGYNGFAAAEADGYGVDYLAKKDLLEVSELAEALDELRKGKAPHEIYLSGDNKLEGYLIEKFDAIIRSFGTIYEIIEFYGLDAEDTLAHLVGKIEYNARRADTKNSGVKSF